jgi:hypothetical protein
VDGPAAYFERWKFRHPQPADFFAALNEASSQDMTWFFDQVYESSNAFDYGIQAFTSEAVRPTPDPAPDPAIYRTTVVVRRFGEAVHPVDIVTTFRDGERMTEQWDGLGRRAIYTYERGARALSVQVDPNRTLLLDVNYTNNSATLEPRADEAGLKWGLKWLAWLQDLMLTYAFFV